MGVFIFLYFPFGICPAFSKYLWIFGHHCCKLSSTSILSRILYSFGYVWTLRLEFAQHFCKYLRIFGHLFANFYRLRFRHDFHIVFDFFGIFQKISFNISTWRKSGLASNPLFILPGFFLHFSLELSYGYLWFEGNGKIPLGR